MPLPIPITTSGGHGTVVLSASGLPPTLTLTDNGDGTGEITGTLALPVPAVDSYISLDSETDAEDGLETAVRGANNEFLSGPKVRALLTKDDYNTPANEIVASQFEDGDGSFYFGFASGGFLRLLIADSGNETGNSTVSVTTVATNGETLGIGFDYDAASTEATFYTSTDDGASWQQLGGVVTSFTKTSPGPSTVALRASGFANSLGDLISGMSGQLHWVEFSEFGSGVVATMDSADGTEGAGSLTTGGEVWTLVGDAAIVEGSAAVSGASENSPYTVEITATDDLGRTSRRLFTFTVNTLVVDALADTVVQEGGGQDSFAPDLSIDSIGLTSVLAESDVAQASFAPSMAIDSIGLTSVFAESDTVQPAFEATLWALQNDDYIFRLSAASISAADDDPISSWTPATNSDSWTSNANGSGGTYKAAYADLNSLPAVRFTDSGEGFEWELPADLTHPFTIVVVGYFETRVSGGIEDMLLVYDSAVGTGDKRLQFGLTNNNGRASTYVNNTIDTTTSTAAADAKHYIEIVSSGAASTTFDWGGMGGSWFSSSESFSDSPTGGDRFRVGFPVGAKTPFAISDVFVWDYALSGAQLPQTQTDVDTRYDP